MAGQAANMKGHEATPFRVILALSITQIIGYGTLFYSYAILSPFVTAEFGWDQPTFFAALSAGLLAGGLLSPYAGKLSDTRGAPLIMSVGSLAVSLLLAAGAAAPNGLTFVISLVALQMAAACVQYSLAFVSIVQVAPAGGQRGIVYMTLIAGFASTLFWPFTSWLTTLFSWREILLIFAALNFLICLPLHVWLTSFSRRRAAVTVPLPEVGGEIVLPAASPPQRRRGLFVLMLAGFAAHAFAINSILVHMVPLTAALGLGAAGLWLSTLFGPAQVASRLINMVFGQSMRQAWLAVISIALLSGSIAVLIATTPWLPGALIFIVMFGMGSGIGSIAIGTLPLELFGRTGYGAISGWISSARAISGAVAPFVLAAMQASLGVKPALGVTVAVALAGTVAFVAIAMTARPVTRPG